MAPERRGPADGSNADAPTADGSADPATDDRPTAETDDRPTVALLYSGGKDSTLAALLLDPLFDVVLCSCTFGREPLADRVRPGADALDAPLREVDLDPAVAREAVERMVADGYPRNGIQLVHEHAVERVAAADLDGEPPDAVADGTRRDDRAPTVDRPLAQSLEDRRGVDYVAPLAGYGRDAVDALAARELAVESGPSETLPTGDYEAELRSLLAAEHGRERVAAIFPEHVQSRVVGRR